MRGHTRPLTCCDRECAGANGCRMGGYQCKCCGMFFCADEIGADRYCDRCAAEREEDDGDECEDDGE